jgi:hypothetical protein
VDQERIPNFREILFRYQILRQEYDCRGLVHRVPRDTGYEPTS